MNARRKAVSLPVASWQVVQAALLATANRLNREGNVDAAFEILAYVAPVTGEAAESPALSECWERMWEDMTRPDPDAPPVEAAVG